MGMEPYNNQFWKKKKQKRKTKNNNNIHSTKLHVLSINILNSYCPQSISNYFVRGVAVFVDPIYASSRPFHQIPNSYYPQKSIYFVRSVVVFVVSILYNAISGSQ